MQGPASRRAMLAGAATAAALAAGPAAAEEAAVWGAQYWAGKGPVRLCLYRKRLGVPRPGEAPRPVLFLVHGSSNSAQPSFDLTVPGKGEYSLMNVFARLGYDVWTMDHENYGRSSRTGSNSDIASGAEDLAAAAPVVARETGAARFHYCGESSGALRAAVFAAREPARVDRLVLSAFTYTGKGSPTLAERAKRLPEYRASNRRLRDRAMIRSIFTRDLPGTSDMAVAEALADAELAFGDQIPTGTYLDMTANLPVVQPEAVKAPVLIIRGEHDGIASLADLQDFFGRLPNGDRQFVTLSHAAHALGFGLNRQQFWHAMHAFLAMPPPVAA
ncbi:alpha/beta hydrolase [Paracraurococcus lichenis]|uniref:Alpha/beta fold hydrolase n=1 Tax=Paracraurococcus lichenis TaxID=3064888 RepID=A0ABT9E2V7_9PROT|nr:alpha/beta fold hydrolase [Paracraurococcus sp. LOR1-02]MDO9710496.1 alpha/beta fold hydrolase [Paracraurococcus sp. LOR1-02]